MSTLPGESTSYDLSLFSLEALQTLLQQPDLEIIHIKNSKPLPPAQRDCFLNTFTDCGLTNLTQLTIDANDFEIAGYETLLQCIQTRTDKLTQTPLEKLTIRFPGKREADNQQFETWQRCLSTNPAIQSFIIENASFIPSADFWESTLRDKNSRLKKFQINKTDVFRRSEILVLVHERNQGRLEAGLIQMRQKTYQIELTLKSAHNSLSTLITPSTSNIDTLITTLKTIVESHLK